MPFPIRIISYNETEYHIHECEGMHEVKQKLKPDFTHWRDVGICEDETALENIGFYFNLHPLVLEDIRNTDQLPNFEDYDNYLFITLKMLHLNANKLTEEQASIILGENYVITFQEDLKLDVFNNVRERIYNARGQIRKLKADYLFCRLADAVVNNYYIVLEYYRDRIEELEGKILHFPDKLDALNSITDLKREIGIVRKHVTPLKDGFGKIRYEPGNLFRHNSLSYLYDVHDQLQYLTSNFESFREMLKDLMDLHHTHLSHSMNHIMKTLTIITAVFIPLTFIAGIYGMNFEYMPELKWKYGYAGVWILMLVCAAGLIYYMHRKKWW